MPSSPGPAIAAGGERFIARSNAAKAYEKGSDRNAASSSNSTASTKRSPPLDGPGYQAALKVLGNAARSATSASSKA